MKIYSELLGKFFDTADDCIQAEDKYNKELEEAENLKKKKNALISKEKKELSSAIELADEKLNKAYDEYELVKEEAKKILKESNQQVLDILNPAKEKIRKAQEEKYKAISAFNDKFGMYNAQYTGDRAWRELQRTSSWLNNLFNRFFL